MKTNKEEEIKPGSYKYIRTHQLLRDNNHKRKNCDFCNKSECRIEWALKKGKNHSDNPNDYYNLCCSCHRKYDYTEEQRERRRVLMKGSKTAGKPIEKYSLNGEYICTYETTADAARDVGGSRTSISNYLSGRYKTAAGFKWKKVKTTNNKICVPTKK